jgi:alanyl-tRNA synthetase
MTPDPDPRFCATRVRRDFLDFFVERAHREVPSSPCFPLDDPTLLFTNAGMNQFKDVFVGTGRRDYSRAADTQKCIRASGKHNDLEDVGVDTYHHTFFEMLGNWSFGDYFKEDAIVWAWELLTKVWGLPKEYLWATVFGGDEKDGLPADEEAERIWREKTDIDPSHVLRFDRRDNFWEMGDTGPCGPCSEIHIDRAGLFGEEGAKPEDGADPATGVNAGNERFIELWNLVFMQFNRLDDGSLKELPAKHVDTGMGFERVTSVLQAKRSNYDTDLFTPIFDRLGQLCGRTYGQSEEHDIAFRVCADHVRAVTAAFSDGALPSNTGRGYVLRRLIRRAARYGRQALGLEEPFLFELVPTVVEILGQTFPEMPERAEHVQLVLKTEEESFARTLGRGLRRFEELAGRTSGKEIPGDAAFELYATYGFPRDLVELMAREREMTVDSSGWDTAEKKHQDASRSEGKFKQLLSAEQLESLKPTTVTYHDDGDAGYQVRTTCMYAEQAERAKIVLVDSPFYAESGGQIGDQGMIEAPDGSWRFTVEDTQKVGPIVVHLGSFEGPEQAFETLKGKEVLARVTQDRRDLTRKNHTATHLLHKALKMVLGDHVAQQGSYVGPDRLRFDFSSPRGVTPEELDQIERIVNEQVVLNWPVTHEEEDRDTAIERGVVAMFGEKYDERVKVLDVGGWSVELCGGTHVRASGDIGLFVILSERAVAAGVRRIEAVAGPGALLEIQRQRGLLREAAQGLKASPDEVPERVLELQKKVKEAKKKQKASAGAEVGSIFEELKRALDTSGAYAHAVLDCPALDSKGVRELADRAKSLNPDLAVAVIGRDDGRAPFVIVCQGAAREAGLAAGELAKGLAPMLGGGGGGRPELAQGQGAKPEGVPEALEWLRSQIGA